MLILARHGRTAANAQRLLLGRLNIPLDDVGARQAAAVGAALARSVKPVRVIASPLGRTIETAGAIAAACGVAQVETDERWIEVDYGQYDGEPLAEVPSEVWQHWRSDSAWTPPDGESLADVGVRVRAACEELMAEAAHEDVVVVSHVSPIKAAVAWAVGTGDQAAWRLFCDVASISRIRTTGDQPTLVSWNEVAHLDGVTAD
ncbi:MAG TPA: histidine phosphatase family protein [Acidimicrobiales bacterium]|nr:histidine phosphatase family protein [Acidimicrobiales bacterium]